MTHGRFIDRLASGPHFPRQQGGRFTALGVLAAAVLVASCGVTGTRQWSQRSGFSSHSLTWVKASGDQTEGRLSLVEHLVPPGSASHGMFITLRMNLSTSSPDESQWFGRPSMGVAQ